MDTVEIRLLVPVKFHKVLKVIADLQSETVEQSVLRHVVVGLDGDLSKETGEQMFPEIRDGDYQDQLAEMAGARA